MRAPRQRYRVTATAAMSKSSAPSAEIGRHRPLGLTNRRRMSFHVQSCRALSIRITRYQMKSASTLNWFLATACRK